MYLRDFAVVTCKKLHSLVVMILLFSYPIMQHLADIFLLEYIIEISYPNSYDLLKKMVSASYVIAYG